MKSLSYASRPGERNPKQDSYSLSDVGLWLSSFHPMRFPNFRRLPASLRQKGMTNVKDDFPTCTLPAGVASPPTTVAEHEHTPPARPACRHCLKGNASPPASLKGTTYPRSQGPTAALHKRPTCLPRQPSCRWRGWGHPFKALPLEAGLASYAFKLHARTRTRLECRRRGTFSGKRSFSANVRFPAPRLTQLEAGPGGPCFRQRIPTIRF
jgi:hypothetical protein